MKNILTAFIVTICLVLTVLIILTINNYQTRKNEIEESLAVALDQAMESLKFGDSSYSPQAYQRLVSDLLQQILLQVNSDCDVEINILNVDLDHGIVDIEAIEYYEWAGRKKAVVERRTVVLEEYKKEEDVFVEPEPAPGEEETAEKIITATFKSNGTIYSQISAPYGEPINKPINPELPNYYFKGWYLEDDPSKEPLEDSDWENLCPSENLVFIAKFISK